MYNNQPADTDFNRTREAGNRFTSPKRLEELSKDPNWMVRQYVASNHNTLPRTLKYLEGDENFVVSLRATKNLTDEDMFTPVGM